MYHLWSDQVFIAWVVSLIQRFVVLEPLLIVLSVCIPVLVEDSRLMSVLFPCCIEQLNSGVGACLSCLNTIFP